MKKTMFLSLFAVLALMPGCRATKITSSTDTHRIDSVLIVETIRDTVVTVAADSALVRMQLAIDSLGQIYLQGLIDYQAGERVKPPRITIEDNVLTATAEVDSLALVLQLKDLYERVYGEQKTVEAQTVEVEVNRPTRWQSFLSILGLIALLAGVCLLILKYIKPKILK